MKQFAIDLTGVGTKVESGLGYYVQNMLEGLLSLNCDYRMVMVVGKANAALFQKYTEDDRVVLMETDCDVTSKMKRVLWINRFLSSKLMEAGISLCLEPYYCMPVFLTKKVRYVTTIHDLLAWHYPEFLSWKQNIWLRFMWWAASIKASKILTVSNFCKKDIESRYKAARGKVSTLYVTTQVSSAPESIFQELQAKYGIEDQGYYYTVSKLRRNKNLEVLVKAFQKAKENHVSSIPLRLLVSGNNGGDAEKLKKMIDELGLSENILMTGFVSDEERNALYQHAKAFLFPSIFEGFGMPVVEAMALGSCVITTKCASLFEVTQGKANYVEDPHSAEEWVECMINAQNRSSEFDYSVYTKEHLAQQVIDLLFE